MIHLILIIILLLCIILTPNKIYEGIQFKEPYMKKFYAKNNIKLDKKKNILIKNGKKISILNSFNDINAKRTAKNKHLTKQILRNNNIPTPNWYNWDINKSLYENINLLKAHNIKFPVVIKPLMLEGARNVYTDILNMDQAIIVIKQLLLKTDKILIEEQMIGDAHRIIVFNDKIIVCYRINKPLIVGDGINNISYLIKEFLSKDPGSKLDINQVDHNLINDQTILPKGKIMHISNVANGTIGSTQDIIPIENVHPDNIKLFKKISKIVNLNMNGIDYITTDLSIPYYEYGSVLETNANPGMWILAHETPEYIDKFLNLIEFK